jgi:DNA-directed RNA polymerase specialized sigma subunit
MPSAGQRGGHISDKTMTIALQYHDLAQKLSNETAAQIKREICQLETEASRLEHYVSMLCERQSLIIRRYYLEGKQWADICAEVHASKRSLASERDRALAALASMYQFLADVCESGPVGAEPAE